jgi:hypothetical protein
VGALDGVAVADPSSGDATEIEGIGGVKTGELAAMLEVDSKIFTIS